MRVVSLLPSATEIVCALGARDSLVGRSEECDYPTSVRELPVVMRAKVWDPDRPSREIDERVRRTRGSDESLYSLDLERLRELAPELILTQDLCSVCSVTDEEVRAACRSTGLAPRIVSLVPRLLGEVWDSIEQVGGAVERPDAGRELAGRLRSRTAVPLRSSEGPAPVVAIVEWLDPPILAGLWTPEVVRAAGGAPLGPEAGAPGVRTTWPEIERASPDLVIVSPCSFSVRRTQSELDASPKRRELAQLRPPLGTWLADEAYFSRPGPRLADGVDLVRTLLAVGTPVGPMPVERWSS